MQFLLVCLGGALGSGLRYAAGALVPYGTFFVNVLGSFLLALVLELMPPSELRLMVAVGFLGGFTTYSTFNQETLQLMRSGGWSGAAVNVLATVGACLAAGFLGLMLARLIR